MPPLYNVHVALLGAGSTYDADVGPFKNPIIDGPLQLHITDDIYGIDTLVSWCIKCLYTKRNKIYTLNKIVYKSISVILRDAYLDKRNSCDIVGIRRWWRVHRLGHILIAFMQPVRELGPSTPPSRLILHEFALPRKKRAEMPLHLPRRRAIARWVFKAKLSKTRRRSRALKYEITWLKCPCDQTFLKKVFSNKNFHLEKSARSQKISHVGWHKCITKNIEKLMCKPTYPGIWNRNKNRCMKSCFWYFGNTCIVMQNALKSSHFGLRFEQRCIYLFWTLFFYLELVDQQV